MVRELITNNENSKLGDKLADFRATIKSLIEHVNDLEFKVAELSGEVEVDIDKPLVKTKSRRKRCVMI